MRQLSEHFDRSPELVSGEDLRQYFIHLKTQRRFSRQSSTQALCAIKLFWEKTLQRTWPADLEFARATPVFKLPVILSASEVRAILAKVPRLDHRVALNTIYHPHVHYLVPGGGLSLDQRQWVASQPKFLLPVKALSDRCRTLFRQALEQRMPQALSDLPPKVWTQRWVVHSAAVGGGQNALRYLSRYVFKTATGNRQLQVLPNGKLRWPFRHSQTGAWHHLELEPFEFIRRFLQHALPEGFHRVRRFGWLHPGGRAKFNRVRALLNIPPLLSPAAQAAWQPSAPSQAPGPAPVPPPDAPAPDALRSPHCGHALLLVGQWRPGPTSDTLIPNPALAAQRTTGPP